MDMFSDFAVDLDKVLDDFELSEDQKTLPGKVKSSPLPKENCTDQNLLVALKTNQLAATGGNTSNSAVTSLRYDIYEEPCVARDTRCDGAGAVWQASANGSAGDRVHDDGAHSGREAAQCVSVASGKTCRGDRTGAVFDDLIPVKDNREVNGHAAAVTAVVANGDVCTPLALSHFIGDDSIGDVPADGQLNVNGLGGTGNLQSQHASGQHTPPEALGKRDLESASETSAKFLKGEQTVLNHGPTDCSVRAYAGTAGSDNECRTPVSATHILPIDTGTVVSCHDTIAATVAQVSFPRGCDSGYSTIEDGSEQSFALNATRAVSLEQAAVAVARDPAAEVIRSGDGGAKSTEQLQMPVIGFTSLVNDDDNDVSDSELEAMLASSAPAAAQRAAAESRDAPASAAAGVDTRVTPPGLRSPVHHRHAGGQVAAETSRVDAAGGSGERARPRETAAAASAHGKPSYSQSGARPKHRWFKSDGGGTVLEKLVYEPLPGEPSRRERLASDGGLTRDDDDDDGRTPFSDDMKSALVGLSLAATATSAADLSWTSCAARPGGVSTGAAAAATQHSARTHSRVAQWSDITMDDNELQVVIEEMVEGASPTEPEAPAGAAASTSLPGGSMGLPPPAPRQSPCVSLLPVLPCVSTSAPASRLTPCAQAAAAATSVVVPSQVLVDVHAEQQQQQQLRMTGVDVSHGPGEVNNIVSLPANVGHADNLASLPGNIGHADSIAALSANVEHADNITSLPGNVKHAADSITLLPGNIEHVESNASAHANVGHTADKIASLPAVGGHTDSIVPNFRQADSIVVVPANVAHVGRVNTAGERVLDPPPATAADLLTRGLDEASLQLLACDPSLVAQYDTACAAAHPGGQPPDACSAPESAADKPPQKRPTSLNIRPREFAQATAPSSEASSASSVEEVLETSTSEGARQPATDTAEPGSPSLQNVLAAISPEQRRLGKLRPYWVPDNEAPNCMNCHTRFTLTKRRHHCRACGRVMCATCCHVKSKLQYMENKEGRVCQDCYNTMNRVLALEHMNTPPRTLPNPNNPAEYCSTVPPLEQAQAAANQPPPTVLVPVGVLKTEGSTKRPGERKQVMFSDGIRPGGDLTELDGGSDHRPLRRLAGHGRVQKRVVSPITPPGDNSPRQGVPKRIIQTIAGTGNNRLQSLIPDGPNQLPPVIIPTDTEDIMIEQNPKHERMLSIIKDESSEPVTFLINKNLNVLVKMFTLDCCVNRQCWCFASNGMCTVGQDELVIVLEALPDEEIIPCDVLLHLNSIYQDASQGKRVHHMGHSILETPFLESRDHCGFLYMRPTFQCLNKLIVPEAPYLFAVLLQKWEIPWAKVFPIRLMLRLGAEFRYYPCPLVSVRFRKPVYCEIGHTIMNILADLRNYKYQLPQLKGMTIHMEDKKTYINFPRNRYNEIIKVVNNSNDHVMALGANFSKEADSHLVCIQNDDGNYQTQAINIQNKPRKVTGASFVVFNGALKPASGLTAKSSIVEDGLMVQIVPEDMATLKQLLREMKGYTIGCGAIAASQPDEVVEIRWVEDDKDVNIGVKSQIDGRLMDGVTSLRIHNSTDYLGDSRVIRWTEVFLLQVPDGSSRRGDPLDLSRLAETLARACCVALTEHLDMLKDATMSRLGLRVTIDTEKVGYEIGSNGMTLSRDYMNDLDTQLIPVIHQAASQNQDGPITLELIFHILE